MLATLAFGASALCFGARQVVTTAAPGLLDSIGLGWLSLQAPPAAGVDTETHSCELFWLRDGLGSLSYTLTCTAFDEPIELTEFRLSAIDAADWRSGAWTADYSQVYTYEEQWPMSGQTIEVEAGRTWRYEGTMAAGAADWLGGAPRALVWTAKVAYPALGEDDQQSLCSAQRSACAISLASVEPRR